MLHDNWSCNSCFEKSAWKGSYYEIYLKFHKPPIVLKALKTTKLFNTLV